MALIHLSFFSTLSPIHVSVSYVQVSQRPPDGTAIAAETPLWSWKLSWGFEDVLLHIWVWWCVLVLSRIGLRGSRWLVWMLHIRVALCHTQPHHQEGMEEAEGQTTVVDCRYTGHVRALQTAMINSREDLRWDRVKHKRHLSSSMQTGRRQNRNKKDCAGLMMLLLHSKEDTPEALEPDFKFALLHINYFILFCLAHK